MDFRAEMEEFEQSVATRLSKQTVEISQIESNIAELKKSISRIEIAIEQHGQKHATTLAEIATKKELIAQWKAALEEHETKLRANESLVNIYAKIEQNQDSIDQSLRILETKKGGIETAIDDFKQKHPYINPTKQKSLQEELEQKFDELNTVQSNINYLLALEAEMYGFVKLFLALLELIGWRTDPKAIEHEKLRILDQDINAITQSIQSYIQIQESLVELQSEKSNVVSETIEILHQKSTLTHRLDTQRAISESRQTIKVLQQQITHANEQCVTLTKGINDKSYLKTIAPLERLRQEHSENLALLHAKNQEFVLLQDPERTTLKNHFAASLITIASDRAAYIKKKETLASNNQFFKSLSTENPITLANYTALTKLPISINTYAKKLDRAGSEATTLSSIASKLSLWQIAEHSSNLNMPFEARIEAHDIFQKEMQALIAKLPTDNPLNAALGLIQDITTPIQPAPPEPTMNASSDTAKNSRKRRG